MKSIQFPDNHYFIARITAEQRGVSAYSTEYLP